MSRILVAALLAASLVLGGCEQASPPTSPTASVAVQQGPWAARDLKRRSRGAGSKRGRPPFRFFDRGYVVSLGPESAVADAVGLKLRGPAAQELY